MPSQRKLLTTFQTWCNSESDRLLLVCVRTVDFARAVPWSTFMKGKHYSCINAKNQCSGSVLSKNVGTTSINLLGVSEEPLIEVIFKIAEPTVPR